MWKTLGYRKHTKGDTMALWRETKKNTHRFVEKEYERIFQLDKSNDFKKKYEKLFKKMGIKYNLNMVKRYADNRKIIESDLNIYKRSIPLLRKNDAANLHQRHPGVFPGEYR